MNTTSSLPTFSSQKSTSATRSSSLRTLGLALLYVGLVTTSLYLVYSQWAYDDPFITYRYAQNLAAGNGFVYNPGERILSTTTPLFTLLLAALSPLWNDLPHLANLISALSMAIGGLFLWDLARSWKTPWVGWAALFLYPLFPLIVTTFGSETPLYLAFCLGAFAFYARRNYNLAACLAALAVLTRPDGILAPAVLAVDYWIRVRRPIPWTAILIFSGLLLPWFLFAWIYFGSPLPVTLAAKQHQGAMAISQRFAPGLLTVLRPYLKQWYFWIELGLALLGVIWMIWHARIWLLFLSWTALYFIGYTVLGVSRYFWYYAPLAPGFLAVVGLGITAIFDVWTNHRPSSTRLLWWICFGGIVILALGQGIHLWRMRAVSNPRLLAYQAAGDWLRDNTPVTARVGALEIGAIGYYAQRPIIDFAGLIQPEVAAYIDRDTTYAGSALWAVQRYHPEYLVLHAGVFPELEQGYAAQNCRTVKEIPGAPFGYNQDLRIYDCRS
jgi:hypothetical protein